MQNPLETLRKYWKPIAIIGAIGLIAYLSRQGAVADAQPSQIKRDLERTVSTETMSAPEPVPSTSPTDTCSGLFYPTRGFCYPFTNNPPGESWDACVLIPPGTTPWGAISAANGDPNTPTDSKRALVLIYDRSTNVLIGRYDLNPQLPGTWPDGVNHVPANRSGYTITCADNN